VSVRGIISVGLEAEAWLKEAKRSQKSTRQCSDLPMKGDWMADLQVPRVSHVFCVGYLDKK